VVTFPPVSPLRPNTLSCPHPYAPHAQPISFFLILSPARYWVRSTNHLVPRYAVSSITPLPRPSSVQIFSSTPYSQTLSTFFPPSMSATKFHTHTKQQFIACSSNLNCKYPLNTGCFVPFWRMILTISKYPSLLVGDLQLQFLPYVV
jgi:hypothetical protein